MGLAAVGASSAQETTRFLVAAANTPGANSTHWRSDVQIFNPDTDAAIIVSAAFLPSGTDNRQAPEVALEVPPRQAVTIENAVGTLFGATGPGAVRLHSSRPFLAASRTYTTGNGTSGTYGQAIPGLLADDALSAGLLLQVANDPAPTGFRSNLGAVNPGEETVQVGFRVYDTGSATLIGEGSELVPPAGHLQVNDVFRAVGRPTSVIGNAVIEIRSSAPVLSYVSVIDNASGDAVLGLPAADAGTAAFLADDRFVAAAGEALAVPAAGVLGNDLVPFGQPVDVELVSGPSDPQATVTLEPDGSFTYLPPSALSGPVVDEFTYRAIPDDGGRGTVRIEVLPNIVATDLRVSYRLDPWLVTGTYGAGIWVSPVDFGPARQSGDVFVLELRVDPELASSTVFPGAAWIPEDPSVASVSPSFGSRAVLTVLRPGETTLRVGTQGVDTALEISASRHQGGSMEVSIRQP